MDYYEENNRDGFDGYDDGYETFGEYDDSVYAAGDGGAAELEEPNGSGKHRAAGEVYDWLEAVMYALVMIFIIFTFLFRIVGVDGESMTQTLQDRDWLMISHLGFKADRGDIVVITQPNAMNEPLIKRIIGVGGDVVNIDFQEGIVYVNGTALDEPYVRTTTNKRGDVEFPVTVPEGYVFVLGDNRNDSLDSRYSEIGFIDERYLMGKVVTRIYPFEEIRYKDYSYKHE